MGYSEAMANGAFAVVTAIFVNGWWLALTFGVIGMVLWLIVRDFIAGLALNRGDAQA